MSEKYNLNGKETEEDLYKIFLNELLDRKIKSAQDEISKRECEEYNYLKTTTKQLIMTAKNKGGKLLDVNHDKNKNPLVGGVLEITNEVTKDGIVAQFRYNSLNRKNIKYSLISYVFSFNNGIRGSIYHKSIGENKLDLYNTYRYFSDNNYGIDILNSDVLKTIQVKFDPECVVLTNEHFKVDVKKMDFEDVERMCEAYFISGVLSLLTQYDDADVDAKVMFDAKEMEDKMDDDMRLYYYKFAETTMKDKMDDDSTMKEVWYHKDAETTGTMKDVWYHKDAETTGSE